MAKLYTRTGDDGTTGLFGGPRVPKDHARVEAYGAVDELNAQLGVAASLLALLPEQHWTPMRERLAKIQGELFIVGAELASPPGAKTNATSPTIGPEEVACLEAWIDQASQATPPLRAFILPGGRPEAAQLHVCRTACRRAERCVVTTMHGEQVNPQVLIYLNRLGDLLFAWARLANQMAGAGDILWERPTGEQ